MSQTVLMHFGDTTINGELNDTDTAKAFAERLPLTITVNGTGIDFCGKMPGALPYESSQVHNGWQNGDINYNPEGGWFAILFDDEEHSSMNSNATQQLLITVNGHELRATLTDNPSAEALIELLQQGPLTIEMSDYASMEKVGPIGRSLPRTDESITTGPGDIILYQGDKLVIYYDTNSWNFTSIGKIQDVSAQELKSILGSGDVSVTFSL